MEEELRTSLNGEHTVNMLINIPYKFNREVCGSVG